MADAWRWSRAFTRLCRVWLLAAPLAACGSAGGRPAAVNEQSSRSVLLPARLGWLSSEQPSGALPSAIALGGKTSGRVLLYFEFAADAEPQRLLLAELVVQASGAPGQSREIELSRAEPARAQLSSWADQPRARYPRLTAQLASGDEPARLDVTELVRAQRKPGEPLRLLLRAEPGLGEPLLLSTGAAGGAAPRLETYWQ